MHYSIEARPTESQQTMKATTSRRRSHHQRAYARRNGSWLVPVVVVAALFVGSCVPASFRPLSDGGAGRHSVSGSYQAMAFAAAPTRTSRTSLSSSASSRNPSLLLLARRGLVLLTPRQETSNLVPRAQFQGRSAAAATKASWSALSVVPRGGAMAAAASAAASSAPLAPVVDGIRAFFGVSTPRGLFHSILLGLALSTVALKTVIRSTSSSAAAAASKDETSSTTKDSASSSAWSRDAVSLRRKFLAVFWLLRCADWLQGPYFYEVYASKVLRGATSAVSLGLVSKLFLTGFASTALFGPTVGRLSDQYGRKKATLAFSLIYAVGALSTKSSVLWMLLVGRIWSGIGTSLLFSAPESWLVGAAQQTKVDGSLLGPIFGTAYAGDAIVAILAGVMAGQVASVRGPTGPFELSTAFLAAGGILAALLWKENKAASAASEPSSNAKDGDDSSNASKPTIRDAVRVVKNDPKIWLVGCVQSLFEAAMYIFVLQWPPAVRKFVSSVYGSSGSGAVSSAVSVPYGTIFSCFMACCLFGSTLFGHLAKDSTKVSTEKFTSAMLCLATLAMGTATWAVSSTSTSLLSAPQMLAALVASFFAFEACVGMYFPSIGTLRSKYVPDSHRGVIMNLFGIPLNVLVVTVFLSISKLGTSGALAVSTAALGVASGCMLALNRRIRVAAPQ
jgi:MFS transporter, MFS domain-containing protein family, molybdate-anion transporter